MGQLDWLLTSIADRGSTEAVVWDESVTTYADIVAAVERWGKVLDEAGIEPGAVVALIGDYHPESISALLSLVDRACIVVPLTDATAAQHDEFLDVADAEHLIRFTGRDSWEISALERRVENVLMTGLIEQGRPGLVVFSSGSTGKSKGMLHDLTRTLEKFTRARAAFTTLNFLLFDHFGGFNTLLHTLSNGGTVVATTERDPDSVCALVEKHGVELLPVSPTFVNMMLLAGSHERHDLSSLRLLTYGTEMMAQSTLDRARAALPHVEFRQTYGLSETGVLRTKSRDDGSLFLKVGGEGIDTKVVDGTLWVRSRWAIVGYLNAPDPFDEDGWLDTQDRVEVEGEYVKFLGRETDIINVGGNKVYPAEVENALMEIPGIEDASVFGQPHPLTGQIVAAHVVTSADESAKELAKRVRTDLVGRLERFKVPARVEVVDGTERNERFKKVRPASSAGTPAR